MWDGGPIGIPYTIVSGSQARAGVIFGYADESDPGPYPIPPDALIEGGPQSTGDRHVLIVDKDSCMLHELYSAYPQANGTWQAGSGAVFNLRSHALRPSTWTSADAAGLPILPGLVRYDEVASGEIRHAVRFTAPRTRNTFIWPARHYASSLTGQQYPPMGQRFRLKASFDISGFSGDTQVILRALKKYGMILADNGSSWYLSGAPDPRWNNDMLHELGRVSGSAFEAIDESSLMVSPDSGQANIIGDANIVSGKIMTPLGTPLSGISVKITDSLGADYAVATTNTLGMYIFPDVADNVDYTISVSSPGYACTPARVIDVTGGDIKKQNFTCQVYSVAGRVRTATGVGIDNAKVTIIGANIAKPRIKKSAVTTGAFKFPNLPNGDYTITVSKLGRTFTPDTINVTVHGANVVRQSFVRN
jgi:hypothetical protein